MVYRPNLDMQSYKKTAQAGWIVYLLQAQVQTHSTPGSGWRNLRLRWLLWHRRFLKAQYFLANREKPITNHSNDSESFSKTFLESSTTSERSFRINIRAARKAFNWDEITTSDWISSKDNIADRLTRLVHGNPWKQIYATRKWNQR